MPPKKTSWDGPTGRGKPATSKTGYYREWLHDDELARLQTPSEQAVYNQLYRHTWGHGKPRCRMGQVELARRCGIKARMTIIRALRALQQKGHIEILTPGFGDPTVGTEYDVKLPSNILTPVPIK